MKKTKGITLIALVITIVVMLILASIGLSIAVGKGGLVEKAITGKQQSRKAEAYFKLKESIADTVAKGESDGLSREQITSNIDMAFSKPENVENLKIVQEEFKLENEEKAKEKILNDVGWIKDKQSSNLPPIKDEDRIPMEFVLVPNEYNKAKIRLNKAPSNCFIDWGDGTKTAVKEYNEHTYAEEKEYTVKLIGNFKEAYVFGMGSTIKETEEEYRTHILQRITDYMDDYSIYGRRWGEDLNVKRIITWGENNFGRIFPIGDPQGPNIPYVKPLPRSFESLTQYSASNVEFSNDIFANAPNLVSVAYAFRPDKNITVTDQLFANNPKLKYACECFKVKNGVVFKGAIPEKLFANNPELEDLESFGGAWESLSDNLFANNPKLKSLYKAFLTQTYKGTIPENILPNNPNLKDISFAFGYNEFVGELSPKLLANCPNIDLVNFAFSNTQISKVPTNFFDNNPKISRFDRCFDRNPNLTGDVPKPWETRTDLEEYAFTGMYIECPNLNTQGFPSIINGNY